MNRKWKLAMLILGTLSLVGFMGCSDDDDDNPVVPDPGELTIDYTAMSLTEGGASATFQVSLTEAPTAQVRVMVDEVADPAQVTVTPAEHAFTTSNWQVAATFTVEAIDDEVHDPTATGLLTVTTVTTDPDYLDQGTTEPLVVTVIDDDAAPGLVLPSGILTVTESAVEANPQPTGFYNVRLASQPTADVTVDVTVTSTDGSDVADVMFANGSNQLVFTSANWSVTQTVAFYVADDGVVTDEREYQLNHAFTSDDAAYQAAGPRIMQVRAEDLGNRIEVLLTIEGGDPTLHEADSGVPDFLIGIVSLSEASVAQQTVNLVTNEVTATANLDFLPIDSDLVFEPGETQKLVTISVVNDDGPREADETFTLEISTESPDLIVQSPPLEITILDDDLITLNLAAQSPVIPESIGTAYYVVSRESGTIQDEVQFEITVAAHPMTSYPASPGLDFGAITSQAVTLPAGQNSVQVPLAIVDDMVDEQNEMISATINVVSTDVAVWVEVTNGVPTVITDNDTAGLSVTSSAGTVVEGESTTFDLVLDTMPEDEVVISFAVQAGSEDARLEAIADVTFTPLNWDSAQTVTLTTTLDAGVNAEAVVPVVFSAASLDGFYNAMTLDPGYTLTITDAP
jgi:hypothetical protein